MRTDNPIALALNYKGKAVSRWMARIGDLIVGGQPPTFDDIEGNRKKLQQFTNLLFEDDTANRWDPKVRELLVMTLLLRCDQFCEVLRSHPEAMIEVTDVDVTEQVKALGIDMEDSFTTNHSFDCPPVRDHLFVRRVKQALEKSDACETMFNNWKVEARMAFLKRNLPALPIENFSSCGGGENTKKTLCGGATGTGILMDPRCFVDHFNALSSVTQNIHMNQQHQQHAINDMRNHLHCDKALTDDFVLAKLHTMMRSIQRLENHLIGEPSHTRNPDTSRVIPFSITSRGLTNQKSMADVFVAFFAEDYRAGYALDLNSDHWKEAQTDPIAKQENKHLKNLFATIKRAVRMVLMHADSYPLPPDDPPLHKEVLRRTATSAEERIHNDLGFGNKKISVHTLTALPAIKTLEKEKKLPENTPEEIRKFFSSN